MSCINADTVDAWRHIAAEASPQRPSPGRRVRVTGGRKHIGRDGVVLRHMPSRYLNAFRYGGEASHHMREIVGRYGYVVLVQPDEGPPFWVRADYVNVLAGGAR